MLDLPSQSGSLPFPSNLCFQENFQRSFPLCHGDRLNTSVHHCHDSNNRSFLAPTIGLLFARNWQGASRNLTATTCCTNPPVRETLPSAEPNSHSLPTRKIRKFVSNTQERVNLPSCCDDASYINQTRRPWGNVLYLRRRFYRAVWG